MGAINFRPAGDEAKSEKQLKTKKVMVFTEGTILRPPNLFNLYNHASYFPIKKAVEKLKIWEQQGADIQYLTSRKKAKQVNDIKNILAKNDFPGCIIYFRERKESYKDIVEFVLPDILVEDNCRSIGGRWQMTITYVIPDVKKKIKSIVVTEFKGIDHLPDLLSELNRI